MSIWQKIAHAMSYPQSVMTGITGFAPGMLGDARNSTGNTEVLKQALNFNQQVAPSQLMAINQPYAGGSVVDKIGGTAANVMYDPLTWASGSGLGRKAVEALPAGVGQSRIAQELLRGAGTFGKIEDATKTAKAGQLARQAYQATLGAGEYGLGGVLGATGLIHGGENVAAKYLPKLATKLLEQNLNPDGVAVAEQAVSGPDQQIAKTILDRIDSATQEVAPATGDLVPLSSSPNWEYGAKAPLPVPYSPKTLTATDVRTVPGLPFDLQQLDPVVRQRLLQLLRG